MWKNNRGMTLIEALFAFSIYVTLIIFFVSLLTIQNRSMYKIKENRKENQKIELKGRGDDPKSDLVEDLR
jgi:competence protein ComGC